MEHVGHSSDRKPGLEVQFFAPPPDLKACFGNFYRLEVSLPRGQTVTDYLQPAWANLRFADKNPPKAQPLDSDTELSARFSVAGPTSKANRFTIGSTCLWGIALSPLGWARFVRRPAKDYLNGLWDGEKHPDFASLAPLCGILCNSSHDPEDQVEDMCEFFRSLAPPPRDEERILAIQHAMEDPHLLEVRALAERTGLNVRTLERICGRHFGLPPRALLRRQRMMRSLAAFMLSDEKSWTRTIDAHYHDQAHFVHEFHDFMGMSPSEYASMPHPILNAFMPNQKRVWGTPAKAEEPQAAQSASAT
ncbi:AraC family transcriptional regulator [Qipengyuania aquimaris]|uniref:Helix-turn-helix domain-containing protein n=1 Tax=Qipengyuania aquimaris TaxID=255984 RepID=A0A9Q3S392_9SPHN|nr:helix-turn-helix domain-containing protein [Qipengyuania aquimaris]MBY6219256.1 helix-turn-helix domain-containing protein [Qipengyuania aquimaris]